MPRPAPFKLLKTTDKSGITTEIAEGQDHYMILFDGSPFNCVIYNEEHKSSAKYIRMGFVNKAHAQRRADQLNAQFHCQLFSVHKMIVGPKV